MVGWESTASRSVVVGIAPSLLPARFQSSRPPRPPGWCIRRIRGVDFSVVTLRRPSIDDGPCPRHGQRSDRDLGNSNLQSSGNSLLLRRPTCASSGSVKRVEGTVPITSGAGTVPENIVSKNPKIIEGRVGELGSAAHITYCPDAWDICLQTVIDFDKTLGGRFYSPRRANPGPWLLGHGPRRPTGEIPSIPVFPRTFGR